ncbi:MAG: nuclear transport factor 2 family protein [Gammaproteobacteria bacterium]
MASRKIENAKGLYMDGIRDGNVREAVTNYTGDRYTQHSTGVADGIEGFVAFFDEFVVRNPVRDIRIVRALEDGQYVFVQAYQDINNGQAKWITTDLFDTDENDKIIEHWDVISAVSETSVSGHTQIDGPTEVTDLEATEKNKAVVTEFLTEVLINGNFDRATEYVSAETYIQHNPQVADGLDGFARFANGLAEQGLSMRYHNIFKLIGQGNFVVSYSKMSMGDDQFAVFDIFRLENGLIVEHWDNMEMILPEDQWGNSGKF